MIMMRMHTELCDSSYLLMKVMVGFDLMLQSLWGVFGSMSEDKQSLCLLFCFPLGAFVTIIIERFFCFPALIRL